MTREAFLQEFPVSRETLEKLDCYFELLSAWNSRINLISKGTLKDAWQRHFADSAQLFGIPAGQGSWVDLGSGAGFPGLVIAILADESGAYQVTLVESDQRKAAFLRAVSRELGLKVTVLADRIEEVKPQNAEVVSARALAPLTKLLEYAQTHLSADGLALFPKGEKADAEIAEALEQWHFRCEKHPSITDARSSILSIGGIQRV